MVVRTRWLIAGLIVCGVGADILVACVSDQTTPPDSSVDGGQEATTNPDTGPIGDGGCSSRTVDDSKGIFVAQSGTDGSSCGTRQSPCKTIGQAITNASQSQKSIVYVAASTAAYVETVQLNAGLTVEGGWQATNSTWSPLCGAAENTSVTIQGATNQTVTASYNGSATLRDLKIVSKVPAAPGESLYGVFATGASTNLTLDNVIVNVAAGGDGATGDAGSSGANASGVCATGTGAAGSTGATGTGASSGSFGTNGFTASDGLGGGTGTSGTNGTAGGAGACSTANNCAVACSFNQCSLATAGKCAGNGSPGCGASPGTGGAGGLGGGSSVAVFVWGANVTLSGGTFTAANGGNGGNGGLGGDGGAGSAGMVGAQSSCVTSWSCQGSACSFGGGYTLDGGAAGGSGGPGGTGGQGGGGAGGWSYTIVAGADAGVTLNGTPVLAHGDGGAGGQLGGAGGQSGDRWP